MQSGIFTISDLMTHLSECVYVKLLSTIKYMELTHCIEIGIQRPLFCSFPWFCLVSSACCLSLCYCLFFFAPVLCLVLQFHPWGTPCGSAMIYSDAEIGTKRLRCRRNAVCSNGRLYLLPSFLMQIIFLVSMNDTWMFLMKEIASSACNQCHNVFTVDGSSSTNVQSHSYMLVLLVEV